MKKYILLLGTFCLLMFVTAIAKAGKPDASLQFIHNKGQVTDQHGKLRSDIDFKIEHSGVTMFGGNGQLHYQWVAPQSQKSKVESQKDDALNPLSLGEGRGEVSIYRMDVTLVGANPNAQVVFEEPTGYYENYYLAHTGENGAVAKGYSKVRYKNVYPNIDWVIYTPSAPLKGSDIMELQNTSSPSGEVGRGVKYDFIIHPGGNPADIRLRYDGATELKLVEGALVAVTPYGTITEDAPYSYNAETKTEVASKYILQGNELRFDVGLHDGRLIIDPALKWGTYYGPQSIGNYGETSAADTFGNGYLGGVTSNTVNIATTGAHQTTIAGSQDAFVVKFDTGGTRQWATYYGGSGLDYLYDITTDVAGNVYLTGSTHSQSGITTTGTHQSTFSINSVGTGIDAYLVKLNSGGVRQWGTYFGDTSGEISYAVACDIAGNVYIGGRNDSRNNIATQGAYQDTFRQMGYNGGGTGFIAKFNGSGLRIWSTHYNGVPLDIACYAGRVYICGETNDTLGIATTGAHQQTCPNCNSSPGIKNGFFSCFDSSGTRLWGSYYGNAPSANNILIRSIAADARGDIYIGGITGETTGIATTGTHMPTAPGQGGAYLAKFTPAGSRIWGTYYGGSGANWIVSLAAGAEGEVYAMGLTTSTTGIATTNGYKTTIGGGTDAFLSIFSPTGALLWGSYYGGTGSEPYDGAHASFRSGWCSYGGGKLYMGGTTTSSSGIATTGAHQTTPGRPFLVQFDADTSVYIKQPFSDTGLCIGDTLKLAYKVHQQFRNNNIFTVQLSNSSGSFATPLNIGSASVGTGGVINCPVPNVTAGNGYRVRIVATAPIDTTFDNLVNIRIHPRPANFTAGSNSPLCTGDTLKLNSGTTTTGVTYAWAGPNSYSNTTEDPVLPNATLAMTGNYYITINSSGCMVKDTIPVVVTQKPQNVTASNNSPLCTGDTMKLTGSTTTGGVSYAWTGPNNYNTPNVTLPNAQLSNGGTYLFTVTLGNCSDTASTVVTVDQSAVINIVSLTPVSICKGDTAQFYGFPNFAGTNPQMQWQINGVNVPGATAALFKTPILVNGDKVRMSVTPNTTCPGTRMSNEIPITVQDLKAPQVSITADAGPSLYPNEPINFTAVATDAGNAPNYQWRKNGIDIGGATGAVWGANANALKDGDNICVLVTSTYACPSPDTALSNCIQLDIRLSVDDVVNNNSIKVYPNPVKGTLRITSTTVIETITINNLLGQQLLQQTTNGNTAEIDMSALAAGVYVVKVNGVYAVRVTKE